jgi:hypothetical protein
MVQPLMCISTSRQKVASILDSFYLSLVSDYSFIKHIDQYFSLPTYCHCHFSFCYDKDIEEFISIIHMEGIS